MCLPVATLPVLLLQGSQSTKHSETASESDSQSCLSGKETSSGCRKRSWQLCQAKRSVDAHRAPNTLLRPRFIPFLSFFSYLLIYIFVYEGPGLLSQSSTTEPHPQPKTLISETQFSDTFYLFALWYGFPWIVRKTHKLYSLLSSCSYCSMFLNACVAKRSRTDSLRLLWRRIPIL